MAQRVLLGLKVLLVRLVSLERLLIRELLVLLVPLVLPELVLLVRQAFQLTPDPLDLPVLLDLPGLKVFLDFLLVLERPAPPVLLDQLVRRAFPLTLGRLALKEKMEHKVR